MKKESEIICEICQKSVHENWCEVCVDWCGECVDNTMTYAFLMKFEALRSENLRRTWWYDERFE